jgi:selenocysteine lyase/cysteine desulfurase
LILLPFNFVLIFLGIEIKEVPVTFPFTKEEILNTITKTLDSDTKLAVFDHIPSVHPVILPVKEIIEICHQKGVQVLIDGAHALGAIPLDLRSLNADYYVVNCHKWLCNPKVIYSTGMCI